MHGTRDLGLDETGRRPGHPRAAMELSAVDRAAASATRWNRRNVSGATTGCRLPPTLCVDYSRRAASNGLIQSESDE